MKLRLIAFFFTLMWAIGANAQVVEYVHTDALGSPVAITNEAGQVIERTDYEPYGNTIGKANNDRPGYTGHVMDSATGLTYMQQRYYDPAVGRFLSIDPVQANANTGASFNRYLYANSSPYRFIDPDGRTVVCTVKACVIECIGLECLADLATIGVIGVGDQAFNRFLPFLKAGIWIANQGGDDQSGQSGSGERPTKTPNSGEPGSVHVNPGSGQERLYGEDGLPEMDVDYDHSHGGLQPHEHPWSRDKNGRPVRGEARPVPKPDKPKPQPKPESKPKPEPKPESKPDS